MKKVTEETKIKNQVKKYLRLSGWFVFHNLAGLGVYKGISDLTAVKNSKVVFIEIKTSKGYLSNNQVQFRNDIESHGGTYKVVRQLDDLQDWV